MAHKKKAAAPGPKKPRPRPKPATAKTENGNDHGGQAWERGESVKTSPHKWENE